VRRLRKRLARNARLLEPIARMRGWAILSTVGANGTPRRHALHPAPNNSLQAPLVVAFHGSEGSPFEFLFTALPRLAGRRGWWLLCPDRSHAEPGDLECEDEFLSLLTERRLNTHAPVFGLGFSRGGAVAVRFALRHPGIFRAAAAVAGADLEVAFAATRAANGSVPVFLSHGCEDRIAPLAESERLATELARNGHTAHFEPVPGLGHDLEVLNRTLPRILDFFAAEAVETA
jgi:predicted esterase